MKLFDITHIKIEDPLAADLGFAHIYTDGIELNVDTKGAPKLQPNTILGIRFAQRAIKNPNVIGFVLGGEQLDRKVLSMLKENGKPLLFNAGELLNEAQALPVIYSFRQNFIYAKKIGMNCSLASFARSTNTLFSAMQLVEVARLIGAKDDAEAKGMISLIGRVLERKGIV